jgi:glycosyltransferase involved in cell wall biosynthesis
MRLSLDGLRALADLGHHVEFVACGDVNRVRPVTTDGMRGYVVPFASATQRLRVGVPYQVAKRLPAPAVRAQVIRALQTDFEGTRPVLLLEQFPMYEWFTALVEAFPRSPRVLREHNDEPRYAAIVAVHERGSRRAMAVRELKAVTNLYHDAQFLGAFDSVVSISAEDEVGRYGFACPVTVVPAFLSPLQPEQRRVETPPFEYGVFGSLDHGPNAHAVGAFLSSVWPQVRQRRPARLLVAGRAPSAAVRRLITNTPSTELLANPDERASVYDLCRVMIDPSVDGTGVAVKTLEALTFGRPVIGYEAACRGLPQALRRYVTSATTPDGMAEELAAAGDRAPSPVPLETVTDATRRAATAFSGCIVGAVRGR